MNVPREIRQGDKYTWTESHSDYTDAGGYTCKAYFIGPSSLTLTAVADGSEFDFTMTPTQSGNLTADEDYQVQIRFEKSGDNFTLGVATVKVLASLASQVAGYDPRSHIKKVYDALRAAIEGRASLAQNAMTIGGKSVEHMTMSEMMTAYHHYKKLYQAELDQEKANEGLDTGRKIMVRFDNPN